MLAAIYKGNVSICAPSDALRLLGRCPEFHARRADDANTQRVDDQMIKRLHKNHLMAQIVRNQSNL